MKLLGSGCEGAAGKAQTSYDLTKFKYLDCLTQSMSGVLLCVFKSNCLSGPGSRSGSGSESGSGSGAGAGSGSGVGAGAGAGARSGMRLDVRQVKGSTDAVAPEKKSVWHQKGVAVGDFTQHFIYHYNNNMGVSLRASSDRVRVRVGAMVGVRL